jgi:hypothetical protein
MCSVCSERCHWTEGRQARAAWGEAADPFLADGDAVEVSIDGIRTRRNRFATTKEQP